MEQLSNQYLSDKTTYPERILQFGTGVLLRGLVDYFVQKANEQNVFQGSIIVVKSTLGSLESFHQQDHLFTHILKGVHQGQLQEEVLINHSISRVIAARGHWDEIC